MKNLLNMPLMAFCLTLAACEQVTVPVDAPAQAATLEVPGRTGHYSTPWTFSEAQITREEQGQLAEVGLKATVAIYQIIGDASDWRDAHVAMMAYIDSDTEAPSYLREQMASVRMLETLFATEDRSPEAIAAIAYYSEFLVEHRTPEGGLLVLALKTLHGYWSPEKVAAAAARGVEGVDAYLSKRYYCEGCASKKGGLSTVDIEGVQAGEDVFLIQVEQARDQLKAMSAL